MTANLPLLVTGGCSSVRTCVRSGLGVDSAPSDRQAGRHRRSPRQGRGRPPQPRGLRRSDRAAGRRRGRASERPPPTPTSRRRSTSSPRCSGAGSPASPPAPHDSDDRATRVIDVLQHISLLVADEPEFAGAVTNALLGKDPDVEVLRQRIGLDIRDRLAAALGPDVDEDVIDSLEMLYSGALVRAGMGYASYHGDRAAAGEVGAAHAGLAGLQPRIAVAAVIGRARRCRARPGRPRRTAPSAPAIRRAGSAPAAARSAGSPARRNPGLSAEADEHVGELLHGEPIAAAGPGRRARAPRGSSSA